MVKLSIRIMSRGWKYHLNCYLQQKKNSSIFSKKDFLTCCNDMVKESKIKKIKPNLFFHLSNQPSHAWKFLDVSSLAKYNVFSLIKTRLTRTFSDLSHLHHLSTALLNWSQVSTFSLFVVALPSWKTWKILSLFFFHVESVFAGKPNNYATSLLVLPFCSSNKASHLSSRFCSLWILFAIFPYTRETYSRA